MGDKCALLADVPQLQHGLLTQKKLSQSFNCTFRYTDDVLSLSNSQFGDLIHRFYHIELEIKDTTDTYRSASYLGTSLPPVVCRRAYIVFVYSGVKHVLTIGVTWRVSYKRQELLTLREHHVSRLPNVASVSGLPLRFSLTIIHDFSSVL